MNADQLKLLHHKKRMLRLKREVDHEADRNIKEFLPLVHYLDKSGISYDIEYVNCVSAESYDLWKEVLDTETFRRSPFTMEHIRVSNDMYIHSVCSRVFPSIHPLRYMPGFNLKYQQWDEDPGKYLQMGSSTLKLADAKFYFFYMRFSPVIKLCLPDILKHAEMLFSLPEDVCLLSFDYTKLIFRSLENEWTWGSL